MLYNLLTPTNPAEELTMSITNLPVVQTILAAAMSNIDANFPWRITEDSEEPEERLEIYLAMSAAVEVFVRKIFDFDHAFPTTPQLADRVYAELNGLRMVHDITRELPEIIKSLVEDMAALIVGHRPQLAGNFVAIVLHPIAKKLYTSVALQIANGTLSEDSMSIKTNIEQLENYTQVCVWQGVVIAEGEVNEFQDWVLKTFNTRAQYLESIVVKPNRALGDANESSMREDIVFAVHSDDTGKFSVPRLQYGIRWIEDVFSNGEGHLYPDRFSKYRSW